MMTCAYQSEEDHKTGLVSALHSLPHHHQANQREKCPSFPFLKAFLGLIKTLNSVPHFNRSGSAHYLNVEPFRLEGRVKALTGSCATLLALEQNKAIHLISLNSSPVPGTLSHSPNVRPTYLFYPSCSQQIFGAAKNITFLGTCFLVIVTMLGNSDASSSSTPRTCHKTKKHESGKCYINGCKNIVEMAEWRWKCPYKQ
ncbi:hypothetical protein MJO29_001931, partial [Puccinia striiformis f. sp. tritici]